MEDLDALIPSATVRVPGVAVVRSVPHGDDHRSFEVEAEASAATCGPS